MADLGTTTQDPAEDKVHSDQSVEQTVEDQLDFDDPGTATPDDDTAGKSDEVADGGAGGVSDDAGKDEVDRAAEDGTESEFPQELLDAAGIDAERAATQFGSPEALANAITQMDQRYVQAAKAFPSPPAPAPGTAAGTESAPEADTQAGDTTPAEGNSLDWLPEPSEGEEWDADTKRLIAAIDERYKSELAARDKELADQREFLAAIAAERLEYEQQQQQHAAAEYVREFDAFIDALGESFHGVFGEGPGAQLDQNTLQFQNRVQLDQTASQLAAGREAYGQPALPLDELLVRAVRVAFPDAVKQQVEEDVASRQNEFTNRPTQRTAGKELPPGDKRAIEGLKRFYAERGIPVNEDDTPSEI